MLLLGAAALGKLNSGMRTLGGGLRMRGFMVEVPGPVPAGENGDCLSCQANFERVLISGA